MSSLHVALVSQNAALELDIRPRAEAEALAGAGYRVTLVGPTLDPERLRAVTAPGVAIAPFPMPEPAGGAAGQVRELGVALARLTRTLVALARERPIDVVHAGNPPDDVWPLLPLFRAVQRRAPRFVFDQHDVAPVLLEEKYGSRGPLAAAARLSRALERGSFARAALTVFANAEYRRRAESSGLLRADAEVVPNGWRLPAPSPNGDWRKGARHLLAYVGTINEQDCFTHLVDAVARLEDAADVRVVVAGDGSAVPEARRRAAELGLEDSFEWLGWVGERDRISSLVAAADVCVAPEVESEFNRLASFVKLAEYMSLGAPIVAHRLPQSEEVCGDTVAFADDMTADGLARAISGLLADKTGARALGRAAGERFDRQLWWGNVGAPRLVAAYARVFGEPEGAA